MPGVLIKSISMEAAQESLEFCREEALLAFTGSQAPGGADEAAIFSDTARLEVVTASADPSTWTYVEVPFWEG